MATTILLRDIPKKIEDAIDDEQSNYKKLTGAKLNQSKAVLKMLKDYLKCKVDNNFKPPIE